MLLIVHKIIQLLRKKVMPSFLLPLVYRGLVVLAIIIALYTGYSHIKDIGYKEAEAKYTKVIREYEANVNKKIDSIESLATTLVAENREATAIITTDIDAILTKTKGKTLTIIKEGECVPTETFSNTFREINVRTNQTIKELSK